MGLPVAEGPGFEDAGLHGALASVKWPEAPGLGAAHAGPDVDDGVPGAAEGVGVRGADVHEGDVGLVVGRAGVLGAGVPAVVSIFSPNTLPDSVMSTQYLAVRVVLDRLRRRPGVQPSAVRTAKVFQIGSD